MNNNNNTYTILIIDDSPEDREMYKRYLSVPGINTYNFIEAENGEDGLTVIKEHKPDCVLLDYLLPDTNGIDFINDALNKPGNNDIAFVLLTGYGNEMVAINAMKSGAQDYLVKDKLNSDLLLRTVRYAIEKKQSDKTIRINQERLQAILDYTTSVIYIKDLEGRYVLINKQYEKIFHVCGENIIGKTDFDIFPDKIAKNFVENDRMVIKTSNPVEIEEETPHNGGLHTYISVKFPLFDPMGKINAVCSISTDISGRKQMEASLLKNNLLLNAISQSQSKFINEDSKKEVFDEMLQNLLELTGSEYGFIGEVLYEENGTPCLKILAITNTSWNEKTRRMNRENIANGVVELYRHNSLVGDVIATEKVIIVNNPENDLRGSGLPQGHPQLNTFLGMPFHKEGKLLGMVGIVNRPGGYDVALTRFLAPFLNVCSNLIDAYKNAMGRHLAEQKLKKINEDLELIVNERTRELIEKNTELRKLSQAVEQSISSIVITDIDGNIEYVNPKFTEITGYSGKEIIGQNPRILKSGKTTQGEYKQLWEMIVSGRNWQGEFYNKKKNGGHYWELAQITSIKDENGKIIKYLAIKEDITEIKQSQIERDELREQLYHAQKLESVGMLAGGVAHDFNNILMAIIGYANLSQFILKDDDPVKEYTQYILTTAEKGSALTKSMLAFSRKQIITSKPEDLNTVVKRSELLTKSLIGENIEYKLILSEKNPVIMADGGQIEQVIMNLVSNARDAMPEGGSIVIKTDVEDIDDEFINKHGFGKAGKYAVISVTDTGVGIDREIREKIFDPFFTTKDVGKGTGLGLSIVYGIVKQHNGFIDVHSTFGEGTTFFVFFPLSVCSGEAQNPDTDRMNSLMTEASTETILVAEDDESVRFLLKEILERFGYKAIVAINGEDAIQKFIAWKDSINLLILDVKMPGKNGKETYDEIKKIRPDLKAIFLSGYSEDVIDKNKIENESLCFVQKPVLPTKLLQKIREVMGK
ncbi:MAG: response regulator [Planctomycetes bacterium]|nr:response regulator [Planctomycetota bacterium]